MSQSGLLHSAWRLAGLSPRQSANRARTASGSARSHCRSKGADSKNMPIRLFPFGIDAIGHPRTRIARRSGPGLLARTGSRGHPAVGLRVYLGGVWFKIGNSPAVRCTFRLRQNVESCHFNTASPQPKRECNSIPSDLRTDFLLEVVATHGRAVL
jgi:hypothetical protein